MTVRSCFFKFFPTPSFLVMPAACIAVSDDTLRLVELKKGKRTIELKDHLEKKLPPGTLEAGEIKEINSLVSSFKEIKSEYGIRHASLSLPEEKSYIYTTNIPADNGRISEEQVAFTLEKNIPFGVDEVVFDYMETGEEKDSEREVVVIALPGTVVKGFISALKRSGIKPLYFEVESHSLSRAVINCDDPRTHLMVHVQKDTTNISVVSRNIPRFTSTIHAGADIDNKSDLRKTTLWLKEEIERVKSYWRTHGSSGAGVPQTVILCGEMAGQGSEKDIISSGLDMEVNIANVWENITTFDEYIPDISHSESLRFGAAVGLAIREFKRIN